MPITRADLQLMISSLPRPDSEVPISLSYDEVCNDGVFIRIESVWPLLNEGGIRIIASLVDQEMMKEEEEDAHAD